jgi:polysaccharide export outer membrane protein
MACLYKSPGACSEPRRDGASASGPVVAPRRRRRERLGIAGQIALAAWIAAGCGLGSPSLPPAGLATGEVSPTLQYRIQPGDTLDIKLPYHPEENVRAVVRPDGRVMMGLTGDVVAAGLTAEEVAAVVTDRARDTLVDPVVTVTVQPGDNLRVYVGGEVTNPGYVSYRPGLTAVQAIYDRGGVKPSGNSSRVAWVTGVTSAGGYDLHEFNLKAALSGEHNAAPVLSPNDVLVVPPSAIGRLNQLVDLYINGLIPQMPRLPAAAF